MDRFFRQYPYPLAGRRRVRLAHQLEHCFILYLLRPLTRRPLPPIASSHTLGTFGSTTSTFGLPLVGQAVGGDTRPLTQWLEYERTISIRVRVCRRTRGKGGSRGEG